MDGFNAFVVSFCTGSILIGSLYMLCPSGSMNRGVKYIFCLCFVCCAIGSIKQLAEPDFSKFNTSNQIEIVSEQSSAVTAQMVFCEALRQQNINFRKITVDTNKYSDGSISIDKVTVYTNENESKIISAIGSRGYEVRVVNE